MSERSVENPLFDFSAFSRDTTGGGGGGNDGFGHSTTTPADGPGDGTSSLGTLHITHSPQREAQGRDSSWLSRDDKRGMSGGRAKRLFFGSSSSSGGGGGGSGEVSRSDGFFSSAAPGTQSAEDQPLLSANTLAGGGGASTSSAGGPSVWRFDEDNTSLSAEGGRMADGAPSSRSGNAVHSQADAFTIDTEQVCVLVENLERTIDDLKAEAFLDAALRQPTKRVVRRKRWWAPIFNNLLLLTLLWQGMCLAILCIIDAVEAKQGASQKEVDHNVFLHTAVVVLIVFQVIHIVVVITASVKLTKQLMHRTVTVWFLAQSYISIVLLFSGIFLFVYKLDDGAWEGVSKPPKGVADPKTTLSAFIKLLYFSIATMTSTGFGDIRPHAIYNYVLTSVEMLVGVLFSVVLFARLTWRLQFANRSATDARMSASRGL